MSTTDRRDVACLIDLLIIFIPLCVLCELLDNPEWFWRLEFELGVLPIKIPSVGGLVLAITCLFNDLIFRNASIGKKIMGLVIVDLNWQLPSFKMMLKREITMPYRFFMLIKSKFAINTFTEWEMKFTQTQIVTRKEYLQRKKQSK